MIRFGTAILLSTILVGASFSTGVDLNEFRSGSYATILEKRQGEPFLLMLWSTTCAPCRDEFKILSELRHEYDAIPVVLVATDTVSDHDLIIEMQKFYDVDDVESWVFADNDAKRLRFEIDSEWYGELPRSYFFDSAHVRVGISGGLERATIEDWLRENANAK